MYTNSGVAGLGGLVQETPGATQGSPLHKPSHAMDDTPAWEAHGTSYEFSGIRTPVAHPPLFSINKALSVWANEKIRSESNIAALAEHAVDMDHPCVRVYTKEEVDANRKFLAASAESSELVQLLRVCSFNPCYHRSSSNVIAQELLAEIMESQGKLIIDGKQVDNPRLVLDFVKDLKIAANKERDELKPQWLRDWRDSQSTS